MSRQKKKIVSECPCPVCGKYSFSRNGDYDICPECGWENDPIQNNDEEYEGGANKMSLKTVRKNYLDKIAGMLLMILVMFFLCCCGSTAKIENNKAVKEESVAEGTNKEETNTGQAKKEQANTEQANTEQANTEQANTEQANTEQTNTEQTNTEQAIAEQENTEQINKEYPDTEQTTSGENYRFRSRKLLDSHFEKHGIEMGFGSPEEYQRAASMVAENPDSLHKTEKEDGDDVYYLEPTNEFVVVSTDGYIRTYFLPDRGKSYFDRQ